MQNGQVEPDAFFASQINVQGRVNFAVVGEVDANVACPVQVGMPQQVKGETFGSLPLFFKRQASPFLAKSLAELAARGPIIAGVKRPCLMMRIQDGDYLLLRREFGLCCITSITPR